ncbi:tryptophan halogenase family protein [Shewanella youngdeokensis]|uniref:Tryptophan halogenase family protein n=1 Tax=Shewanella youngdeokensis TaxID=2999068 RepID=A0ABZ0JZZ2_9GAMM|nr:tryptophan halogenase family protein [Shewanella sp. DAU334]
MPKTIKKIAIVGGGTAGWLTAAILAAHHRNHQISGVEITLIESSDIPTIGVGEGTWPTMKNTLQQIGLKESDVFKTCNATFKQGGKFVDWVHGNGDFYYHPFTVPLGYGRIDLAPYVSNIKDYAPEANFQHAICEAGLAPRGMAEGEYQGRCNYAYHLDAGAFAEMLKQHCKTKLNVNHLIATVDSADQDELGNISRLRLGNAADFKADLFIDCSGLAALLIGKTLKVPFIKQDKVLFNDRALAMQVPYDNDQSPIASHTIATAQNAGWIWDIGLTHRRGVGHVYSSQYLSDEQAERNLRQYIGPAADGLMVKKICFESGHRERFWQNNCVAVGMAAGFVEPLEATAIMLVEMSARFIAENLPVNQQVMAVTATRFNQQMDYRWRRIIDFLKLHYMLTQRKEPYWQAHCEADSIPQTLKDDLAMWAFRGPTINDFNGPIELFPAASYQYVLYGMEFKPDFTQQAHLYQQHARAQPILSQNQQLTQQMLNNLPPHRDYITRWLASTN